MIHLTLKKCRDELARIAADYGRNHTYGPVEFDVWPESTRPRSLACEYTRCGAPACYLGVMLNNLGIPIEILEESRFKDKAVGDVLFMLKDEGYVSFDLDVPGYLNVVQSKQDSCKRHGMDCLDFINDAIRPGRHDRHTWGEAFEAGDAFLKEEGHDPENLT